MARGGAIRKALPVDCRGPYAAAHAPLAQTTRLAELLADPGHAAVPAFLLADLNCDRTQAEFAPLDAVAMDTWAAGGGDPDAVTLSSAVPFAPLEAVKEIDRRIDHILARRGDGVAVTSVSIMDESVDGTYPSDHFAVVADVDWWVVLLIGVGSVIGGQLGASVGRRLPPTVLRIVIVCVGVVALGAFLLG